MNDTQDFSLAEKITQECERTCTNLCSTFDDWTKCAMALAALGEDARSLFHRLAALDTQYKHRETDIKFTNCLRTANRTTMASLIYLAETNGINVRQLRGQLAADGSHTDTLPREPQKPRISEFKPQPLQFIQPSIASALEGRKTALTEYLADLFGKEIVDEAFKAYHIGGIMSPDSGEMRTLFPQIDEQGRWRTGKVILYLPNGHRNKALNPTFLHSVLKSWARKTKRDFISQDFVVTQCLFGQHLLSRRPNAVVGLVEAEKTATTMSIQCPQLVWVALGSKSMLSAERLRPLQGREVKVFPDADGVEEWRRKLAEANKQGHLNGIKIQLVDWSKDLPQGSKLDIADIYLANIEAKRAGESEPYELPQIVRLMFPDNPCGLYEMCEMLKLEVVNEAELKAALNLTYHEQEV